MLEGLVSTILNRFLGMYIQNFDPKQLNIGIWSGDVKLRDLELRKDALDQLKLPINVLEGHLGNLSLQIPWSNLKNKPVRVEIQDVFILVAPKADHEYDEEEEIRRRVRVKLEKLQNAELLKERVTAGMSEEEQNKNTSFMESLVTKIVDNLQVSVRNIHIRYEDALSTPGHPFSVGFTLEEFSAVSTNEEWVPHFIQGVVDATHKLVKLGSLAVYWNTDSTHFSAEDAGSHGEMLQAFKRLISTGNQNQNEHQFILKPVNGIGRLRLDKTGKHENPAIKAAMSFDEIGFVVDEDQYRDALMLVDLFHFYIRHQQFKKYRPKGSTPKSDPRAWLNFATTAILDRIHEKNRKWSWEYFKERRDDRKRYIELFVKKRKNETLTPDEQKEHDALEAKLSYEDLRFYRSLGRNQLRKERAVTKAKEPEKPAQKQGWVAWVWGSGNNQQKKEEGGDATVMTDEQKKELFEAIDWDEQKELTEAIDLPKDTVKILVESTLRTGSFTLRREPHGKKTDVLSLVFETFKANLMTRPESFLAELSLGQLKIFDGTTEGTLYPQIVKLKDRVQEVQDFDEPSTIDDATRVTEMEDSTDDDGASTKFTDAKMELGAEEEEPFFQASFEKNPLDGSADSAFTAKMRSMEIIYNPRFVEGAYKFFKPPERHMESINALMESASATVEEFRQQTRAGLEFALEEHKTMNAKLDLQAPLIIIPESVTKKDTQCLVLDVGHIRVSSDLVKKEDMEAVQNKQKQQYTDKDYEQLENLMYDKFKLQFHSTQVLIGPSISETLAQLNSESDSKHLHIVDRINIDFLAQISILPKAPNLTRFKVSGHLPTLQVSVSDRKYKTLMRLIDVAIPNFDDEEVKIPERQRRESQSLAKALELREQRPSFVGHDEIDIEEGSENGSLHEDRKTEAGEAASDTARRIMQRNFQLNFTVDKLSAALYQTSADGKEETKLVELVAKDFSLLFYIREFDMAADVVLDSLSVDDFISTETPPELRTIITSTGGKSDLPLFQVNYKKIKPNSPEFVSVYEGIDMHVDVLMSTLSLVVTPKTVLTLLNFILATFTNPEGPSAAALTGAPGTVDEESAITDDEGEGEQQTINKIKVKVDMASVKLIFNHDGIRLATLTVDSADCNVFTFGPKLRVGGHIGKFSLTDDIDRGALDEKALLQLVKVEGENLAEFKYETFTKEESEYPGYDTSIYLRCESIVVFFVEEPFRKLFNFAIKFGRMQALFNSARQAALNQAAQIQQGAGKMHFDVLLASPVIVFPRPGQIAVAVRERDVISAYPGEIFAHNRFEEMEGHAEVPINIIEAGIRNIRMASTLHYDEEEAEDLEILNKVDLNVSIRYIDHDGSLREPNVEVKSGMSDIKVKLTQCQYAFMLEVVNIIPGVFTIDEVDDEQVVEELPIHEGAKTNLKEGSEESLVGSGPQSLHPELQSPAHTWTYLDVLFDIGTVGVDLHMSDADKPVGDLHASSLSTAYLTNVKLKLKGLNNGAMESELLVDSFNMRDTRRSGSNLFRKVVSSTNTEGHQIMASMRRTGGKDQSSIILVTVDSPTLLFSLDYLFTLQKYVMAPFNAEPSELEQELELSASSTEGATVTTATRTHASTLGGGGNGRDKKPEQKKDEPSLAFRVNIVDAQVILIADPGQSTTEAILLRTKQVVFAQQNALTLQIGQVGMFLCRMDAFEESRLRLLDDFSVSGSLTRKNTVKQSITNADIQVDPLVLRVSLRDILLAMQIVNKALEMTNAEPEKTTEPPSKLKQIAGEDSDLKRRTASGKAVSTRPGLRSRKSSAATRMSERLRQNQAESGVISKEQLSVEVDGVRFVLIGDQHELPLVDMSVKRFEIHLNDWSGALRADTDFETFINVYNFSKSAWEPLLEPWQLALHASRENTSEKIAIDIYSRKIMDLSISSQTIALFSRASEFLQRNEDMLTKPRRVDAPYLVKNQTGFDIDIWAVQQNGEGMAASLADGEECPWRFEMWEKMREHLNPEGQSGIVGIKIKNSPYETIQRVPVTREGESLYLLKNKDGQVINTLLCDVKLAENNIKNIVFRSPLLVENNTAIPVELGIWSKEQKRIVHTYKILPGESQPAPIEHAWSHALVVRPDPGFGYAWSTQSLTWKEVVDHPTGRIICGPNQEGLPPFIFQMHTKSVQGAKSSYPRIRVGLFAPIEVQNLLPFDFNFRVYDKRTGKDWTNFLRKGGSSPVHVVELSSLILLSIIPQETVYGASEFAIINSPNTEYSQESSVLVKGRDGPPLNIKLHYHHIPDGGGAFRVSVYAPYIILNKTGLNVAIKTRSATEPLKLPGVPLENDSSKALPYMFSFHNDDNKNRATIQVGDSDWSKPQSFEAIGSANEVALMARNRKNEVNIGVSVDEGKGKYKLSKIVTLTPRYIIRNKLNEDLLIRQVEGEEPLSIKPGQLVPLHSMVISKYKQLCLCFPGQKNRWTSPFSISDLGSIHLKIAKAGKSQELLKVEILAEKATVFLNIVRETRSWPYSIRNESDLEFTFFQSNPVDDWDDDEDNNIPYFRPVRYRLPERSIMPYAWDYPAAKRKELTIKYGEHERTVKLTEIGNMVPFKIPVDHRHHKIIDINVLADGPTQTLVLSNYKPSLSIYKPKDNFSQSTLDVAAKEGFHITDQDSGTTFSLKFALAGIGISLINRQPKELAYITLRDLEFNYSESSMYQMFKVLVKWIQIDNQLYGGIFPIILYPSVVPKTGKEMDVHPSFHASVTRVKDDSYGLLYIKIATMLLQQMTIELDEDFIFALLDFTNIPGASWTEPEEDMLFDDAVTVPQPTEEQGGREVYFEFLNIQPAQLDLSFMRTEVINAENKWSARNPITFLLNVLTMAVGNVNDAPIKFNALMLENARVSLPVLSEHIQKHYSQAFIYQIHKVLGSADFLGNPVGLFNNISSGVYDIFYEPYQGFMMTDRPQDLGIGIAKGATSFFKKSVFGVSDSLSKFTGSISKGLSAATMDKNFQDRRRMSRNRNRPKHALYGVTAGAQSFATSLASGAGGLLKKPIEGATAEGPVGFLKGIGKGVVGLTTKPVIGVFDLASNVTEGIRNTTTVFDQEGLERVRLTRYIGRDGVVRPYSQREALGQFWLKQLDNGKHFDEEYVAHLELQEQDVVVLVTYRRIMLVKAKRLYAEWDIPLREIRTISKEKTGITLVLRGRQGPFIPVRDREQLEFLFGRIAHVVNVFNSGSAQ